MHGVGAIGFHVEVAAKVVFCVHERQCSGIWKIRQPGYDIRTKLRLNYKNVSHVCLLQ
jgi:hypothetical protein